MRRPAGNVSGVPAPPAAPEPSVVSGGGGNRLLSPVEVADWLGMPLHRVHDNWRAWNIPFKRVGRYLRVSLRDLEAWYTTR